LDRRIEEVLVKQGDEVREKQAVATVVPDDKEEARHDLEPEGLLVSQFILMELQNVTSVVSKITYRHVILATVVGKRRETTVTTHFNESLR
jgi:multidrug efflux pump subunit AcrA (membrane-fusion protein)